MAGKITAVKNGEHLRDMVAALGVKLGLQSEIEVKVGRRIWGAKRSIDVVLTLKAARQSLGIECKYQNDKGSAEEKIPAVLDDIKTWPIRGIVVLAGAGFSQNIRSYLLSTGAAVDFEDLEDWLKLYFCL